MIKNKLLKFTLALAFTLVFCGEASAHGHDHAGHEDEVHELAELFVHAVKFEAALFPEDGAAAAPDPKWKRQKALIDSGAMWLITGWVRAYYRNLHKDCPDDQGLSEAHFMHDVQDHILRTGMIQKFHQKLIEGTGDIVEESADIGARLGRAAFVVKIAAEIGETVLSKMGGGAGMHFFCTVFDAAILFGTRHMQTAFRTITWADQFGQSSAMALMRSTYVRNRSSALFNKMRLVAGPIELDEHEVEEIDEDGPNRWWGIVKEGKRAKFLRKFAKQTNENGQAGVNLYAHLNTGRARVLRTLWIKKRHRTHAQSFLGDGPMDSVLNYKNGLWLLAVQEGMVNRANERLSPVPADFTNAPVEPATPVIAGLIDELHQGLNLNADQRVGLGLVLNDIEYIFDTKKPKTSRHVRALAIETLLGVFTYRLMKASWDEQDEVEDVMRWRDIFPAAKSRWTQASFVAMVHEFAEYLALGCFGKDSVEQETNKYAAQNYLVRIFSHLQMVLAMQRGELTEEQMQTSLKALENSAPWNSRAEKLEGRLFWKKAPLCENI